MKDTKESSLDTHQSRHKGDNQPAQSSDNQHDRQSSKARYSALDTNAAPRTDNMTDIPEFIKKKENSAGTEQLKILTLKTRAYTNSQQRKQSKSIQRRYNPDNPFLKSAGVKINKLQPTEKSAAFPAQQQMGNHIRAHQPGSGAIATQKAVAHSSNGAIAALDKKSKSVTTRKTPNSPATQTHDSADTIAPKSSHAEQSEGPSPARKVIIDESLYDYYGMTQVDSFQETGDIKDSRHLLAGYRHTAIAAPVILVVSLGLLTLWWNDTETGHNDTGSPHAAVFDTTPPTDADSINLPVVAASSITETNPATVIGSDTHAPPRSTPEPETDANRSQRPDVGGNANELDIQISRILDTTPAASTRSKTRVATSNMKPEQHSAAKSTPKTSSTQVTRANKSLRTASTTATRNNRDHITTKKRSPISHTDLTALLTRLSTAYEKGNAPQLVRNFAADIYDSDGADREQMKKDYQRLFNITDKRQLKIQDVTWSTKNKHMLGKGDFEVLVREKGASNYTTYAGTIRFVVAKEANTIVIKKLDYEYNQ